MQILDPKNEEQATAARNWGAVTGIRRAWMDLKRPVDLVGRVRTEDPDVADLLVIAEADAGEDPEVWLMPEDGSTSPFDPEKYEKRPLSDVEDVVEEGPVRYDRAWDIVQEYRGEF